ncbi:hypothetical protein LP420_40375 [Massilia sp. B-10]|nr:hypothetical protein LP420_40375 [Massilia sp. B-10]
MATRTPLSVSELAVTAGEDAAIVADHAILAGAAADPVVAVAADQIVVLAFAEHHVAAFLAVDEVVARLAVDFVGRADIVQGLQVDVLAARGVVEQVGRAHHDFQRTARFHGGGLVVVEHQRRGDVA